MNWKRWQRFSQWPGAAQAMLWLLLGMAIYAEWVWLAHPDLLDQAPRLLVYRAGFAGGLVIALFWWLATVNERVHKLERKIEELERRGR